MVMEVDVEAVSVVRSIHEEAPCSLNTITTGQEELIEIRRIFTFALAASHGNLLDNSSDFFVVPTNKKKLYKSLTFWLDSVNLILAAFG